MRTESTKDYWDALDRLIKGRPQKVDKGVTITNDAVSQEAGRGKGTIKKSRPGFKPLITAITEARAAQARPSTSEEERIDTLIGNAKSLQGKLDAALAREMSLVYELLETKRKLASLTGEKVLPIRSTIATPTASTADTAKNP